MKPTIPLHASFLVVLFAATSSVVARAQTVQTAPEVDGAGDAPRESVAQANPTKDVPANDSSSEGSRRVDHFRAGVLGGVGFPRPLELEGMVKIERVLGLGAEYSVLPTLTISGVETSFWALALDARIFPFKNGFYLGLKAGRQHLAADASVTVERYGTYSGHARADTTFLNPSVGFLWTWDSGITLGIDAGVQLPVASNSSNSLPRAIQASQEVTSIANSLGNTALPTIDLLRVGFLF
jgi:hypothetical protein